MMAIARCQRTTGMAAASRKPPAPTIRAFLRSSLCFSALVRMTQLCPPACPRRAGPALPSAPGNLLADGEFTLAVAEPLAVEAHQVDRRQIRLRVDAGGAHLLDRAVAID